MIEDLFGEATARTKLSETQVIATLAGALALIRKHADPAKAKALFTAVPGASDLAEAGAASPPRKGLFGGLVSAAGGAGGAAMSDAMALQGRLQKSGVRNEDLKSLLAVAREFVQRKTGRDLLGETLKSIPGVGGLLAD